MIMQETRGIDLNCDTGEAYCFEKVLHEEKLFRIITSANIACGFHAGDPLKMLQVVSLCRKNGVQVGVHPGYPDPMGFGRRPLEITPEELGGYLLYQWGALDHIARSLGVRVKHMKLHGALYHKAAQDESFSREVFRVIDKIDQRIILVAPVHSLMYRLAVDCGVRVAAEAFADRAYDRDGWLVPRGIPGSVIEDPVIVAERALSIVRGEIGTIHGSPLKMKADTICLHGDTAGAVGLAESIRRALDSQGIPLVALENLV